jgi:formate dehydrogenase major subunit
MHTGQLTRNLPWLRELNPDNRVEMSEGLAAKLGVKTGDLVVVKTPRNPAGIKVKAHVTNRVRPLVIDGREFEVVAMPFHWGFRGPNPGAITNTLTTDAADFFAAMPETKVALCRIERVG